MLSNDASAAADKASVLPKDTSFTRWFCCWFCTLWLPLQGAVQTHTEPPSSSTTQRSSASPTSWFCTSSLPRQRFMNAATPLFTPVITAKLRACNSQGKGGGMVGKKGQGMLFWHSHVGCVQACRQHWAAGANAAGSRLST